MRCNLRNQTTRTESEKVTALVGTFLNGECTGSLFKRAIGYTVFSASVQVPATKTATEKVAITVATFSEDGFNN